ncbi:hypothetical protein V8G54_023313 [Vigna mungo]|uniref:Uncharacterized protein n=1 Tax=Vigna mungo TaxID=3915 RepID=A0AAQ3RQ71_VIGMU
MFVLKENHINDDTTRQSHNPSHIEYLKIHFFMKISQTASRILRNSQPGPPRQNRGRDSCQEMLLQALIRHKLVNQKPLDPSFIVLSAVPYQPHQIRMLHHSQQIHLVDPLLVPLLPVTVELLDRHLLFLHHAAVHGPKPPLANQEGAVEPARGALQRREWEEAEVVGAALHQVVMEVHRIGEFRGVGIEVGAAARVHETERTRPRHTRCGTARTRCRCHAIFVLCVGEVEALHLRKSMNKPKNIRISHSPPFQRFIVFRLRIRKRKTKKTNNNNKIYIFSLFNYFYH